MRICRIHTLIFFSLLSLQPLALVAQSDALFYKGYDYGSQAQYNPLSVIMNGSLDILQVSNRNNKLTSIQFAQGFRNVWWNLTHAGSVISQYGGSRFLESEVFPASLRLRNAQYWPNYQLHLFGGGFTYVATAEWFGHNGFPSPWVWSIATMVAYHVVNEAVENGGYAGPNVDPIADLLIFDPLGIVLFSIDGVAEFFSHTLHAADWSFQPYINVRNGSLLNNGQNFILKLDLPWFPDWRLFYLTGMEGGIGVSRRLSTSTDLSLSGGLATRELVEVDQQTGVRTLTARLVWTGGIFYDRNGSLLASCLLGGGRGYIIRLNMYPGVFDVAGMKVGGALLIERNGTPGFGLSVAGWPAGIGF